MKPAEQLRMIAMWIERLAFGATTAYSTTLRNNSALLDECERVLNNTVRLYEELQGHQTAYSREARATFAKLRGET